MFEGFTFTLTPFFPEGMGGVQNISGNSGGVAVVGGGVILMVKKWKFWGGGRPCTKFPAWWG